jgi:hypothetical protein
MATKVDRLRGLIDRASSSENPYFLREALDECADLFVELFSAVETLESKLVYMGYDIDDAKSSISDIRAGCD